jgi:S-adenosylmethionine-dependent methyltransferase
MKETAKPAGERFQSDAERYAAYLATPEGRLRLDLALANLQEVLSMQPASSLRALDLGGGTGATAVRLARLGVQVTLLDFSPAMLDIARQAAAEAGVGDKIALQVGDAARLADLFSHQSFDVILCHDLLEYLDEPDVVLGEAVRAMRDSSSIVSVLVRNQAGEVLKAAIQAGNFEGAENSLTAEWGQESLYGGKLRLFTLDTLHAMLKAASLTVIADRGVRVVADYLPRQVSRSGEYDRIFALERKLGRRPEFTAVARYLHCLARRRTPRQRTR